MLFSIFVYKNDSTKNEYRHKVMHKTAENNKSKVEVQNTLFAYLLNFTKNNLSFILFADSTNEIKH